MSAPEVEDAVDRHASEATSRWTPDEPIQAETLCEAFAQTVAERSSEIALRTTSSDTTLTWQQFDAAARDVAGGLCELGISAEDRVVMVLTNRMEAAIIDMAVLLLGAIPISLYNSSSVEQLALMVEDSGAKLIVTERQLKPKVDAACHELSYEPIRVVVDGGEDELTFDELRKIGTSLEPGRLPAVGGDDVLAIIYTSGTTGRPKGVQIKHGSVMSELRALREMGRLPLGGNVLSYLPFAHLGDRLCSYYMPIVMGATIFYHPDPRTVVDVLPRVQSTLFMTVPRIWQKIQVAIETFVDRLNDVGRRDRIRAAIDAAKCVQRDREAGLIPSSVLIDRWNAGRLDFAWLREEFGFAKAEVLYTGAAQLPPDTLEFFTAIGIEVIETYGLSETSGLVLCNPRGNTRPNRVGLPLDGNELRIAADGELLIRGRQVMKGYWGQPALTAEVISPDGWLSTGDIADVDDEGFWRIVDRKKEIIVSSTGKNMAPAHIENTILTASPLFAAVICVGDAKPYNCTLVTLEQEIAETISGSVEPATNASHPDLVAAVRAALTAANVRLNGSEQVKRFLIVPAVWLPGGDELTPTSKVRRRNVHEKYADHIAALYEPDPDRRVVHDVAEARDAGE